MARLTGKVALITGAAGGQGTAEAELFVREEGSVVLTDIDATAGDGLAQRLSLQGGKVLFLRQDVADEASWKETLSAALAHFGKLHILVNNAGTIARQGIIDTTVEAWNRTLAVNLTGAMLGMKHCAPAIRDSGGGSIINISSTAGLTAHDDAAYTASKWGLRGLTKTAVLQFSQWNIRVHTKDIIPPGCYDDSRWEPAEDSSDGTDQDLAPPFFCPPYHDGKVIGHAPGPGPASLLARYGKRKRSIDSGVPLGNGTRVF